MSESEQKGNQKKVSTGRELAVIRKPLMLEADNEEAAAARAVIKAARAAKVAAAKAASPKSVTVPTRSASTEKSADKSSAKSTSKPLAKKPRKTISETTAKKERTPKLKPSAKTRVIPVTTPAKSRAKAASNPAKTNKKEDMKLPLVRKLHFKFTHVLAALLLVVCAVFFGRVALWEHAYVARMEGSDRDTPTSNGTSGIIYDGNEYDETEPSEAEIAEYVVAPDMPRYFSIPSLGISRAIIEPVGLRADGAVDTPRNVYRIGWYNGSSKPGSAGTALLDAHGGDLGNGIFKSLPRIQAGAEIKIEMGDSTVYTYVVADTATRPLSGANNADSYMPTALSTPENGVPSLTLITCTGEWSQIRHTYLDRFFVRALLQQ